MTKLLLRMFVKNHEEVNNPDTREKIGILASWSGIILNVLLVLGKGITGILSGSVSVLADGMNNLMDVAGSVITLIGFKISGKKADEEHPYGHGRFEYIAGLTVAVLVLVVGIELGKSSLIKIINPTPVSYSWVTLIILFVSVFLKLWMGLFSNNLGEKINSTPLIAVSVDSKNDAITTFVVLITALISRLASVNLDGWTGLAVAIFIVYNGIILIKDTINPILGQGPSEELVNYINNKIRLYESVLGVHDLIVHDYGPGKQYASAHVELDCKIDPLVSHGIIEEIEGDFLKDDNIHMVIHYDPV